MLIRSVTFQRLCRARDLLHETSDPISVAGLAEQAGMSQFHFIRQFEAVFGSTPHQLRIQARIERAKHMLQRDRASVTEVCMDIGFSSLGSFSSSFARRVGMSPSDYRRSVRALSPVATQLIAPGCYAMLAFLPAEAFRNFGEA
jgi:AraC-like DNA-binding protein